MFRNLGKRLYEDFFMPSRLSEYAEMLRVALHNGYSVLSIEHYLKIIRADRIGSERFLVLRHDVDSDVETAKIMLDIECSFGVPASYYFRLCTIDTDFMHRIARSGGEVGYHYEEIATFSKKRGFKTRAEVEKCLPEIRDAFRRNLLSLRSRTGLPMKIVASHGDWMNRRLRIFNHELFNDELRREMSIEAEAYDPYLSYGITSRISDNNYPTFWNPVDPRVPLSEGSPVVYVLTHPRHWASNVTENFQLELSRISEAVKYHLVSLLPKNFFSNGNSHSSYLSS
ncbi:hypothetical protein [Desulfomonile tiedjei]|uniref:Uncharacterized protein n=1 Tax=Desulfomonile tiedjei (strain ATCC 49306 / DSM 6799 / DCB-1) TaxID=706587 RepID=I4CBK3_DESTA|nr:hypothetical protein [Desulfomonile tiedjei]AFM26944.1 hypothetical protein Desti_4310 [Desulfomonile tiedjei DSM 6799]